MKLEPNAFAQLQTLKKNSVRTNLFVYIDSSLNRRYILSSSDALVVENIKELFIQQLVDFEDLLAYLKDSSQLQFLLKSDEMLSFLIENEHISKIQLESLFTLAKELDLESYLSHNSILLSYGLSQHLLAFDNFLKTLKKSGKLSILLKNQSFFKNALKENLLSKVDFENLLHNVHTQTELQAFCLNTALLEYTLSELLIEKEALNALNHIVQHDDFCRKNNMTSFMQYLQKYSQNALDHTKLLQLTSYLNDLNLDKSERDELCDLLNIHQFIKNDLKSLLDYGISEVFDFECLKGYIERMLQKSQEFSKAA